MNSYLGKSNRHTVKAPVRIKGKGVHSGQESILLIEPAEAGSGLVFYPSRNQKGLIPVSPFHVIDTSNAVTLGNDSWQVQTVEHFLAACSVIGLTDARLTISSHEMPIMDGSSLPFFEAIQAAGLHELPQTVEPIELKNAVWVVDKDRYIVALPSRNFKATYSIHYDHPALSGQSLHINLSNDVFEQEIMRARTFGFLRDVEALRKKGLGLGATEENTVVLTDEGFGNSLRYENECVRHKILDLVGDLYLMGRPLKAHIVAHKAGHSLDVNLAKRILTSAAMDELARRREQELIRNSA
jgi:UDP-3-O-[3-hydroxymyristoyl] N-acetylglucosamine deacetylase